MSRMSRIYQQMINDNGYGEVKKAISDGTHHQMMKMAIAQQKDKSDYRVNKQ